MWGCGKVSGQPLTASQRPGLSQPAGRPLEDTAPQQRWGQGPHHRILPAKPQTPSPWARKGPRSGETLRSPAPCPPQPSCPDSELVPHALRAFGEPPPTPPLWWSRPPGPLGRGQWEGLLGADRAPPVPHGAAPSAGPTRTGAAFTWRSSGGPNGEGAQGAKQLFSTCYTQPSRTFSPDPLGIPRRRQDRVRATQQGADPGLAV